MKIFTKWAVLGGGIIMALVLAIFSFGALYAVIVSDRNGIPDWFIVPIFLVCCLLSGIFIGLSATALSWICRWVETIAGYKTQIDSLKLEAKTLNAEIFTLKSKISATGYRQFIHNLGKGDMANKNE